MTEPKDYILEKVKEYAKEVYEPAGYTKKEAIEIAYHLFNIDFLYPEVKPEDIIY